MFNKKYYKQILLVDIFTKNEKVNLTDSEKAAVKNLISEYKRIVFGGKDK